MKQKKNLGILIPKIYKELRKIKFELIIVDDNSNDGTSETLKRFKKKNFKYIIRKKREICQNLV